eukprot:TRINITY_DN25540_c0_g1_i1.p1 TRINITY_DN25540_c0_g1~~TRINITY_DN25540_c0_g1_i1.p1  ORF type:complete len:568 (+),score=60.61 TRINITY_DN25540_c0_g1_i1:58-1704(+)
MGWFRSEVLNHLFMYETFKVVRIRDKKLGIARILITCAILSYVIGYELIYKEGYLIKEAPHGAVTTSLRRGDHNDSLNSYCRNGSIPTQEKLPCLWLDEVQVLNPPGEEFSMFITTRLSVLSIDQDVNCMDPIYADNGVEKIAVGSDGQRCPIPPRYSALNKHLSRSYFIGDIEYFTMMWSHAVYGLGLNIFDYSTDLSSGILKMPRQKDINFVPRHPTSELSSYIEKYGYFGHISGDILTIETFLKAAGIGWKGLDENTGGSESANCELRTTTKQCDTPCFWAGPICAHGTTQSICESGIESNRCTWDNTTEECVPVPAAVNDTYCLPSTLRYDGGVFIVMINYNTPKMRLSELRYEYDVQHIPKAQFKTVIATRTAADSTAYYNRHGLRIIFVQKGFLTQFSFKAVLLTLVTGIALFSLAKIIVELVVMKLLPDRKVYENYKYMVTKNFADIDTADDHLGGLDAEDFAFGIFKPGVEDIESNTCDCTGPQTLTEASPKRGTMWLSRMRPIEKDHTNGDRPPEVITIPDAQTVFSEGEENREPIEPN